MSGGADPAATPPVLPYGRQVIGEDDIAAVTRVLRSGFLTTGPEGPGFEADFARAVGARDAVAVSSGTAALHLALLACGVGPGDRVVVPSITFVASANTAVLAGAHVTFCDCDAQTGLIDLDDLDRILDADTGRGVKAIVPVHLNGPVPDMARLAARAAAHGAVVIEDACHALGTRYRDTGGTDRRVGDAAWGPACFSLHPVKTIAAGEGGVITTNDPALAQAMRDLRNHGLIRDRDRFQAPDPGPWAYELQAPGFNYRLSDIHAALARSQLAKLARFRAIRRQLAEAYDTALKPLAPTVQPVGTPDGVEACPHLYAVLIDFDRLGQGRAGLMAALRARGIGSQVHYRPVHDQPFYRCHAGARPLPGAEAYAARVLSLPLHAAMTTDDVTRVVEALAACLTTRPPNRP